MYYLEVSMKKPYSTVLRLRKMEYPLSWNIGSCIVDILSSIDTHIHMHKRKKKKVEGKGLIQLSRFNQQALK